MADKKPEKTADKDAPLACSLCMAEMPHDLAHTHEGPDYVHHFCGLECYRKWMEKQAAEDAQEGNAPAERPRA